jgi:hypothetical protein
MNLIIDKDTQIYNINISNMCEYNYEYGYFSHSPSVNWGNTHSIGIYITINKIVTTFIPCYSKDNLENQYNKKLFESFLNGKNINYLNNHYSLDKNIFELSTINQILNMDTLKITNIDDLTKFYNKMELLEYIKFIYIYDKPPNRPFVKTKQIMAFYYTDLFINKIIDYYSKYNIIKFNNNNLDINAEIEKYERVCGEGYIPKTTVFNIVVFQSKICKKSISFYKNIDEFIKQRSLDKKYKIHQLEPLLIEELPDDIANPINLLDLTVDEKPKNTETELINL